MKLELTHIAPYFEHELIGLDYRGVLCSVEVLRKDCIEVNYGKMSSETFELQIEEFKPCLFPISMLTKKIEHNGEKFVPFEILDYKARLKHVSNYTFEYKDLQFISHDNFEKLLSWHFDVFGLIDSGLATDKSTIK